jgi:hypothetical protein
MRQNPPLAKSTGEFLIGFSVGSIAEYAPQAHHIRIEPVLI